MGTEVVGRWGTWEELLLGGAVLRHGTRNWNVVAAELRSRTLFPYTFTPEVCKAKYEDLQQQYSGSMAWFEELRKKRVAELKRALELSEDSIGSLESKIESLKTGKKNEKRNDCDVDNESDSPELHMPTLNLERVESSTKEMSKDGLSAGSFTHETRTNWSPECQVPAVSADNMEIKLETEQDKVVNVDKSARTIYEVQGGYFKKRRGKRKRKECGRNTKEASVGESDLLDSTDVLSWCKESSTSNCGELAKSCGVDDQNRNSKRDGVEYVMDILDSIFETKSASTFRRRLDSQATSLHNKFHNFQLWPFQKSFLSYNYPHCTAYTFRSWLVTTTLTLLLKKKSIPSLILEVLLLPQIQGLHLLILNLLVIIMAMV